MPDQSVVNPLPFLSGLDKSPNTVPTSCDCLYFLQILCLTQVHQGSGELNRNARHHYHSKSGTNTAVKVGEDINSVDSALIHKLCFSVTQKSRCLSLRHKFCLLLQTDKAPSPCKKRKKALCKKRKAQLHLVFTCYHLVLHYFTALDWRFSLPLPFSLS